MRLGSTAPASCCDVNLKHGNMLPAGGADVPCHGVSRQWRPVQRNRQFHGGAVRLVPQVCPKARMSWLACLPETNPKAAPCQNLANCSSLSSHQPPCSRVGQALATEQVSISQRTPVTHAQPEPDAGKPLKLAWSAGDRAAASLCPGLAWQGVWLWTLPGGLCSSTPARCNPLALHAAGGSGASSPAAEPVLAAV